MELANTTPPVPSENSVARRLFTSLEAYAPFDRLPDCTTMDSCMDPRPDQTPGPQTTKIMGPGGELGELTDVSQALTVIGGQLVTPQAAYGEAGAWQTASVPGAHYDCAYELVNPAIVAEQGNPAEQTRATIDRWRAELGLGGLVTDAALEDVAAAAQLQIDQLQAQPPGLDVVRTKLAAAYSDHDNVPHMQAAPAPAFYIVNHTADLGLNRQVVHNDVGVTATAYHDNLGARANRVVGAAHLTRARRTLQTAALLSRSAATRTVVGNLKRQTGLPVEHWEVAAAGSGLRFTQFDL